MALELILALGIAAFLFLYFAFSAEKEHFILKMIMIFLFFFVMLIIPHGVIRENCQIVKANETVSGSLTTFEYTEFCDNSVSTTEARFQKIMYTAFLLFVIYFFVYIFYNWTKKSEKFGKWFKK